MQTDFDMIERFLNRIGERQRHTTAYIHPERTGLQGATYEFKQLQIMLREINEKQKSGYGVYYSLNEGIPSFKQRGMNGKLLASEVIKIHMLGFDIDWITGDEAQRKVFEQRAMVLFSKMNKRCPPSVIVSTGGGIQVLFVLRAPLKVAFSNAKIPTIEEAIADKASLSIRDDFTRLYADICVHLEEILRPLLKEEVCKIDKLSNIDRVFRLPGTVNYPTAAKIGKGATTRLATILYDNGEYVDFYELREIIPFVTKPTVRKEPEPFFERENKTWTAFNKARFLCEYIREKCLIDDNQNYTHDLMFPLFGMINRNEITAEQGRELWLLATSTGRETAYGNWAKKWDSRKIANYTSRDLGSLIFFCRNHECLLPWSAADYEIEAKLEARKITEESLRHPVLANEDELFDF